MLLSIGSAALAMLLTRYYQRMKYRRQLTLLMNHIIKSDTEVRYE
jgi:hypothetical protein